MVNWAESVGTPANPADLRPSTSIGVLVAVWTTVDESPAFAAVVRVVERVLGPEAAETYRGGPWGLSDAAALAALAEAAGFSDVQVQRASLPVSFEGGPGQIIGSLAVTAVASRVAELDGAGRARLLAAAEEELGPLMVDGELRSETVTNLLLATA